MIRTVIIASIVVLSAVVILTVLTVIAARGARPKQNPKDVYPLW